MVFPTDPLGVTVELLLGGTWTSIMGAPVQERQPLAITRGRSDEAVQVEPSTATFDVANLSGDFSPRNPTGAYYGQIGRNTPCRVRLSPASDRYLLMLGDVGRTSTPDSANLSITGDIDIRVEVRPDQWGVPVGLASKYVAVSNQRSWAFYVNAAGTLGFRWSPNGTFASSIVKTSTAAVTVPASGRLALRVTLDVDNGAVGNDVQFYTASAISGSWTQLGSTVTTAGVTSIFDSTASVEIGDAFPDENAASLLGKLYAFQVYQGIGGTLRADVDMATEEAGEAAWTDGVGNVWSTSNAGASIVDPGVRFRGEISEWPPKWDAGGQDVYVPIVASGILRRLGQGASPLKSTMYRGYTSATFVPKAYWPCEDGEGATELASGLGGPPLQFKGPARPTLAAFTGFKGSAPLPTLQDSDWAGTVPPYTATGAIQAWWLMHIPTGAATVGQPIFHVLCTGTAPTWRVEYDTGGALTLRAFDADGTQLFSNTTGFFVNDKLLRASLDLAQNGSNVDWTLSTLEVAAAGPGTNNGTLTGRTIGRCIGVRVNNQGGLGNDIAIGHISVHDSIRTLFDLSSELKAYVGESTGRRIQRLCGEEGVTFRGVGDLRATSTMGPQLPAQLVDLLREAADADMGVLYEPRDMFGLAYRTRDSLCHQSAALALDYTAGHISAMEPTDDDQHVRNDITVQRTDGASARAVAASGSLSISAPPSGVGRYDEQVTLNLEGDAQLPDAAGWLLLLGTVDEARYPVLGLDLARPVFTADQALTLAVQDLDEGDRVSVANPPAWLPPDQISQLAQGFTETLGAVTHRIEVNCSPETPWGQAAIYDDGVSRYSSDGSTLAAAITTTSATSASVATATGPLWTHADGDFDIRIGGEVMTVTAISGSTSPQTFTVTRSVNGVQKTHPSGAVVELAHPRVYARR